MWRVAVFAREDVLAEYQTSSPGEAVRHACGLYAAVKNDTTIGATRIDIEHNEALVLRFIVAAE